MSEAFLPGKSLLRHGTSSFYVFLAKTSTQWTRTGNKALQKVLYASLWIAPSNLATVLHAPPRSAIIDYTAEAARCGQRTVKCLHVQFICVLCNRKKWRKVPFVAKASRMPGKNISRNLLIIVNQRSHLYRVLAYGGNNTWNFLRTDLALFGRRKNEKSGTK